MRAVHQHIPCPRCNRPRHLTPLRANFQCADLIGKFCGFLAQVKAITWTDAQLPGRILGAGWRPQHEQIIAGIFQPLFIVAFTATGRLVSIHYVPAHILQSVPDVFEPRKPLGPTAKRANYTLFNYNLTRLPAVGRIRLYPPSGNAKAASAAEAAQTEDPTLEGSEGE